ncbi:MAG: phosphomannomutase/phosphoglucomutase [Gammaproteobacteria bacterium]
MGLRGSRRSRRKRAAGNKSGGLTLGAVSLLATLLFCAIIVVIVFVAHWESRSQIQSQQINMKRTAAELYAQRLGDEVQRYSHALWGISMNSRLHALLQDHNTQALQDYARQHQAYFPGALSLRIFKQGMARLDTSQTPHVGYACLDLLHRATEHRQAPPAEAHVFATPQQHVDIVQPITDATGQVLGHVQLALATSEINAWVNRVAGEAYIEVTQAAGGKPPLQLASGGSGRQHSAAETIHIPGTAWQARIWLPASVVTTEWTKWMYIVALLAIVMSGLVVLLLKRSVSATLRADLDSFMRMIFEHAKGAKKHDYSFYLPEFAEAARMTANLDMGATMERERDDDPEALKMASTAIAPELNPMFMSQDNMSVEELSDEALSAMTNTSAAPAPQPQAPAATFGATTALPPAVIFKAYDIRGIVGSTLTAEYAHLIGQALGSEARARGLTSIAFARDGRLSGPELGQALVKGLQQSGINVIDVGMVPTPVLYYAAAEHTQGTGVMLTGSHNPPDYNGFKMVLGGDSLSGDAIQGLRQRIENNDFTSGEGQYKTLPVTKPYMERIGGDVRLKRPLKVVIDCGNGVASVVAPKLFKAMGCEVIELYCDVDGKFPNHHPDPSKPENLRDVIEAVKLHRADLGLAFDGDGDRVGVIDSDGKVMWPDRLMMLFAADVLSRNPGAKIIFDIKCSNNLTKVIWEKGGEPLMWKTGHSLIKAKMKDTGALLAGEMSGHIFFKERWYGFDDGIYSAARLLEILAAQAGTSAALFATLPNAFNTPELNISMAEGEHHHFMEKFMQQADFGSANVMMIDGVRADFEDGWGLVRASNTTPVLVLRFEGKTPEALQRIQDKFKTAMQQVEPNLNFPF